jgi:phage-related protein
LTVVVISDNGAQNGSMVTRAIRGISWIKAAQRAFEDFPAEVRSTCFDALTIAAEGGKAGIAKPQRGMGSGVFDIALPFHGDAFRVVYAVQLADVVWVIHAFQKKSKTGCKTPAQDIELVKARLMVLRGILR